MVEVAKLVGIEHREYRGTDGMQRTFTGLHLCYVEDSVEDVSGSKVESVSCPREVDFRKLKLGDLYQLDYSIFNTKNGKSARLVNLLPVEG